MKGSGFVDFGRWECGGHLGIWKRVFGIPEHVRQDFGVFETGGKELHETKSPKREILRKKVKKKNRDWLE